MSAYYQVINWDRYENNRSRQVDQCRFVCVPNKQDGMGLTRVLAQSDGASIYGIWCLIIGACSRHPAPRDGHLTDGGASPGCQKDVIPWTVEDMALRWRMKPKEVSRALEFLSSDQVGWLKVTPDCRSSDGVVTSECPEQKEQNRRNRKKEQKEEPSVRAQEVWEFWQAHLDKPKNVRFNAKRLAAVERALANNWSVGELCDAIRGCKVSPHHQGENKTNTVYDDLELICRDDSNVERFIGYHTNATRVDNGPPMLPPEEVARRRAECDAIYAREDAERAAEKLAKEAGNG